MCHIYTQICIRIYLNNMTVGARNFTTLLYNSLLSGLHFQRYMSAIGCLILL